MVLTGDSQLVLARIRWVSTATAPVPAERQPKDASHEPRGRSTGFLQEARADTPPNDRRRRLGHPRAPVAFCIAGLAVIVLVVALGMLHERGLLGHRFELDAEYEIPGYASSALLLAAAVLCWASGATRARIALGAFFLFMAADELLGFHESLEGRTGADWQALYIPVVTVGGAAWWAAARGLPWRLSRRLLVAGATAWLAAAVLENRQWSSGDDAKVAAYAELMVAEETLEMLGSFSFGLAFATAQAQQSRLGERRAP
jgi:hypothetical protein